MALEVGKTFGRYVPVGKSNDVVGAWGTASCLRLVFDDGMFLEGRRSGG